MTDEARIRIPETGLDGLKALINLGPAGISALCDIAKDLPLTLNIKRMTNRLSKELGAEESSVSKFVMGALMPLNHLRVHLKLETADFVKLLSSTLAKVESEGWQSEHFPRWRAVEEQVQPLFEKDNIFSIVNKSYQMLLNRPNPIQGVKILSELRPVYNEDASSVKAFVLAKTLAVDYAEGETKKTIFLSMDMDDLRSLTGEVDRAKLKIETISEDAANWGVDLLIYGEQGR